MAYRKETETLRAQVEQLRGELSASQQTIARLRGEASELEVRDTLTSDALGVALAWQQERRLPFELGDEGYEALAQLLRTRLPGGKASQVGRTLLYEHLVAEVKIARDQAGGTVMSLRGFTQTRAWGIGVVAGMCAFLALLPVSGLLMGLGMHPSNIAWAYPLTLTLVGLLCWKLLSRHARRRLVQQRAEQTGVFEALLEVAGRHAPQEKRRIAAGAAEGRAELGEEEAAAAEAAEAEEELRS